MSNIETSKLYESVIDDVINDSRQDFENSGIDESTLQELKKLWQEKLTLAGVANFSWEKPEEDDDEEEEQHVPTIPVPEEPEIKLQVEPNTITNNNNNNNSNSHSTADDGIASRPKLEAGLVQTNPEEDNVLGIQVPKINQADGTFEMEIYTSEPGKLLKTLTKKNNRKKLVQFDGAFDDEEDSDLDDSNDLDSDINSELDDDDPEDQDDDQEGQVALCLYDKVQRIKSKWKCSLKEGIANINGKDYVFNKATGECEW
ncbi:Transcription initiation factor IIA large subunit [Candida viswanathii]|uniref:Transcription initiation factor IIA large subunit n=1 Tax=Candida viswanathii TaxID=5486 RepID=A0A367Y967_9ASCO|nr:Transcription initiation factor IIA large subunit [Candida viswanathii]